MIFHVYHGRFISREVLTIQERQMAACAMLAALAGMSSKVHADAALDAVVTPKSCEIFFRDGDLRRYAGGERSAECFQGGVLEARGEWASPTMDTGFAALPVIFRLLKPGHGHNRKKNHRPARGDTQRQVFAENRHAPYNGIENSGGRDQ